MTVFLGVYKALYDYEPQTAEELGIKENDVLYLLEKSDVDEWWTVKKRVIGSDAEEPVGLVPSNYVEPATAISVVRAVYDYEQVQNPDEELVFHENDVFDVFDDQDPDWLLVQSQSSKECGFVPGNYVEAAGTAAPTEAPAPPIAPSNFQPPPQHPSKTSSESPTPMEEEQAPPMPERNAPQEKEDVPPPKPARPVSSNLDTDRDRTRDRLSYNTHESDDDYNTYDRHERNGHEDREAVASNEARGMNSEFHTWNIAEVDGRKKRKCKLSIGNNRIYFQPQKGTPTEWTIDKLTSYDNEKKHMFLEFIDPYKSLELHTGNNDTCMEIMTIIGEFKGASRDAGLREVEMASKTKKQGTVLYDFIAESQDELSVKQGQAVYILNDKKSRDWWMCEVVGTGKRGVVPAQFIEPSKDNNTSSGGILSSFKKFTKSNKSPSKPAAGSSWKNDEEQDIGSSERKTRTRSKSTSERRKRSTSANKAEFPDPKKTRIWVDRSGTFKVDAQFIGCSDGKIHLHKANGVKIAVAADKLSDDDLLFVERTTGFSLDKHKGKKSDSKDARESERERRRRLREQDERERDRRLRERELEELRKARDLLDQERAKLQERDLAPPAKPPRPMSQPASQQTPTASTESKVSASSTEVKQNYDWFEFFLNCGVDVSNCQRYTINFERENITEDMMKDINPAMLRTLGLREGDIVRVNKYLDQKFGRDSQPQSAGGLFSKPDGSLLVPPAQGNAAVGPTVAQQLLPQHTAPAQAVTTADDDAWTVKPAVKSEINLSSTKAEFTGSMQDLLDLQPLEPKQKPVTPAPEPKIKDLEPVKTGNNSQTQAGLSSVPTGGTTLIPLDPFKTGGHNLLPMATGFVMMPIATGGLMSMQRTGGIAVPQTTFGTVGAGNVLQPQRTSGGLIPISTTGGIMPQTSFGVPAINNVLPLQRTGGYLATSTTGGMINVPPLGSVLPLQKTATGLLPVNTTGGFAVPQSTGGMMPLQRTGGGIPQTSFGFPNQPLGTGNAMPATSFNNRPQLMATGNMTGGMNMLPQTTFGTQITGGANMMPQVNPAIQPSFPSFAGNGMMSQNSFPNNNMTTGANFVPGTNVPANYAVPQTSFGSQTVGNAPQTSFGGAQLTGGIMPMQRIGGLPITQQFPQMTGGFQQNGQLNIQGAQYTGQPLSQFSNGFNSGLNNITQGLQNASLSQQPLQTQPTGFGFGNGPEQQGQQQPQQQSRQANLFNATADNPFGF
ncbi:hypothetical protein HG536_0D04460 [Torulaspora globosa]|uniref:Actin cytoskeleton-regulatory complex protein SLA1 n=1 Tax=Torulaspora globosa TaxID=48254 RepID=A0A7G3ZHD8_9SACH|nr:uncharacterized protein HG536_0D04460 [Torulaspora globosa]QLL32924.1 hypothetical protein HG536_0D04460 [Torulaspora globosa]